jgi:ATP-dependent Clp protease protease subunit
MVILNPINTLQEFFMTNNSRSDSKSAPALPSLESQNVYVFFDDFTSKSVKPVVEWILQNNLLLADKRPDHLTLIINSPGGDLNSAFALIDIIKGSAVPIHTLGLGQISSCGLLTFIAGHKGFRVITPMTSILSHQYSWGSYGKEHELLSRVKEFELTSQRMMGLYKHCTGLSESKIKELLLPAQDVWLSAEEAVEHGLADSIKRTF